jgi:hypothetical protein
VQVAVDQALLGGAGEGGRRVTMDLHICPPEQGGISGNGAGTPCYLWRSSAYSGELRTMDLRVYTVAKLLGMSAPD